MAKKPEPGRLPDLPIEVAAQELLDRRAARTSLIGFCRYMHPNWIDGPHHAAMCEKLDRLVDGDVHRLILNAPPRHSKSEIVSRMLVPYYLSKHPNHQVILASYNDQMAADNSRDARNYIKDQRYRDLCGELDSFPGCTLDPETTAGSRWETMEGGVVIAAGIGGALTGRGAHCAIIDDPLKDRADADSARIRENVWKWYASVLETRLMPGGRIVCMQTRWHEDDLAGLLMRYQKGQWDELIMPAIANEHTENEVALWEECYSLEWLRRKRDNYAAGGNIREWYSLYQQNPSPEEGTYCKREWYEQRWEKKPDLVRVYMASDWAVTSKADARDPDFTVHGIFGLAEDDRIYVLDWWRGRASLDETIPAAVELVGRWKPAIWFSEKGIVRRAVEKILERTLREDGVAVNIEWTDVNSDKAAKGRAFQAWSRQGRFIFPAAPWANPAIENIIGFPTLRHDDDFDVCAIVCGQLDEMHRPVSRIVPKKRRDPWQRHKPISRDRWKTL